MGIRLLLDFLKSDSTALVKLHIPCGITHCVYNYTQYVKLHTVFNVCKTTQTVCELTHCGQNYTFRIEYEKNPLKLFTLTSWLAWLTNIRYAKNCHKPFGMVIQPHFTHSTMVLHQSKMATLMFSDLEVSNSVLFVNTQKTLPSPWRKELRVIQVYLFCCLRQLFLLPNLRSSFLQPRLHPYPPPLQNLSLQKPTSR